MAGALALAGCTVVPEQKPMKPSSAPASFILVHGAWHGAWCWDQTARLLRSEGHSVSAPTLAGLGKRSAEDPSTITLDTHIGDVLSAIDASTSPTVILVAHSYAGFPVTAAASRRPQRVATLVYLDAFLPEPGQSFIDAINVPDISAISDGGHVAPMLSAEALGLTDPALAASVMPRLTGQPAGTFAQPVDYNEATLSGLSRHFIHASGAFDAERAKAEASGFKMHDIDEAGHDAMITAPETLAKLLLAVASAA